MSFRLATSHSPKNENHTFNLKAIADENEVGSAGLAKQRRSEVYAAGSPLEVGNMLDVLLVNFTTPTKRIFDCAKLASGVRKSAAARVFGRAKNRIAPGGAECRGWRWRRGWPSGSSAAGESAGVFSLQLALR